MKLRNECNSLKLWGRKFETETFCNANVLYISITGITE